MRLPSSALALLPLLAASSSTNPTADTYVDGLKRCNTLAASLTVPNGTVNFVNFLPAGTNITLTQSYNLQGCGIASQVVSVDLCRVAMYVATSARSGITMEVWLPSRWTGRFLSTGNGGINGCIGYADMAYATGLGFASVGTNNGHNGTNGLAFANNMDVVEDYAHRAMHTGVVLGKQITKTYYGSDYKKSYYLGCSTGGRQGFKSVQAYPNDFDGVVAGAPAFNFPSLIDWSSQFYFIFGNPGDATFVTVPQWMSVHAEVLNQCDGIDGALDGIIEDPELCRFRPEALQCPPGTTNSSTCLTGTQVGAVRRAFTDYYGSDGKLIYPRMQPGSEVLAAVIIYTPGPFPYGVDWFRYVVYNDPTWNPSSYTLKDAAAAIAQNPFNISSFQGDISAFKNAGGKLLHYHGQMDAIITSENSPVYYNLVSRTMGLNSSQIDDFYRLFRVSGMGHCGGGDGAWMIGHQAKSFTSMNPQDNVLMRMVDWVENGNAPETITGTKYVNDTVSLGVQTVRNHCKYPKRNICIDKANHQKPEAWKCVL